MTTARRRTTKNPPNSEPSEPLPDAAAESEQPAADAAAAVTEPVSGTRAVTPDELRALGRLVHAIEHEAELATELPTVHQCMAEAMRLVRPVGKLGQNKQDGYAFKRIDDFMDAANGALGTAGVHIEPKVLTRIADNTHETRSGAIYRWIDLEVRFRFYGPRGDHFDVVTWGEGRDASDKATNKALTAAMKYALMYALMIPTSDIQDGDRESPSTEAGGQRGVDTTAGEQRARDEQIAAQIRAATADADTVLSFRHDVITVTDREPVGKPRHDALTLIWRMAGNAGALGCEVPIPAPWARLAGKDVCTLHELIVGAQDVTVPSEENSERFAAAPVEQEDPWATPVTAHGTANGEPA